MTTGPAPGAPNAVRGIVIVVVAGVLGLFLLARGGTSELVEGKPSTSSQTHVTSTTGNVPSIAPAPTTVAAPVDTKAPSSVTVAIFNATGGAVTGAAGNAKSKLVPLGFSQITLADATQTAQTSAVYYESGYEADATAIAQAVGLDAAAVAPADGAENNPGAASGASVVVVIGTDTAQSG